MELGDWRAQRTVHAPWTGSPHSPAGFASTEVEEQRRACCSCVREHGPDSLAQQLQRLRVRR
uniref:Uncharacterized protein n=1 Tax=Arundo donax TaxID=35708 RepID=A0A0A9TF92_ARUDO